MKMLRLALALSLPIALAACTKGPPEDTGPVVEGDADSDADSDTDTDTDADGDADCDISGATPVYEELFGADGAVVGANPYTTDAGLGAIIADKPAEGETLTGEWVVTGAVVGAVGYYPEGSNPSNIWFNDVNGTVRTYYVDPGVALSGGEVVSFTATEIKNYYGTLEITAMGEVTVTGSDKVWLTDGNNTTLSYETHAEQFVYAWGEIMDEGVECGGSTSYTCFDFQYGVNTTTLRILSSKGVVQGDCAQVVVPLGTYSGADQMDVSDLDWFDWID